MEEDGGKNFIEGAFILSAAGIIAKLMGFVYRIILPRVIGEAGVGLYQLAYPIYTTLLVVSRSGVPVALAKLISDRITKKQVKNAFKIFKVGRKLSICLGLSFFIIMVLLSKPLINILNWDPKAIYTVLAISPAIFFVSIMATYRGFFQGLQNMVPTAFSQIIEQFVRMVTMIGLVYLLIPYGIGPAAGGATFGAVTGSIAGLMVLLYIYSKRKNDIWENVQTSKIEDYNTKSIIKDIASLGIPVTVGAAVLPLMNLVDAVIVPHRLLVAGFENVTELYGRLTGYAMVLVNFPTIITISLAASLVPAISEAFALDDPALIKRRTENALRLTVLIGFPASVGLFVLAQPLTAVIFDNVEAAVPLRVVSWGVIFITLQQTTSAILQGIGKPSLPALNLFIGAIINGIINFILTGMPQFGIIGAALGTVIGFGIAAFLNLIFVKKFTNFSMDYKNLIIKPVLSVILMGIIVQQAFEFLLNFSPLIINNYNYTISTFLVVIVGVFSYGFMLLLFNEVKYNDLILIPGIGQKMANLLQRLGLVGDNNG